MSAKKQRKQQKRQANSQGRVVTVAEADKKLLLAVLEAIAQAQGAQLLMIERKSGCACSPEKGALCEHHQSVWTKLDEAMSIMLDAAERLNSPAQSPKRNRPTISTEVLP